MTITLRSLRGAIFWLPLALLLGGCGSNTAPSIAESTAQDFVTPPFYRIDGNAGGTLLLMGTVHLGPPEGWRFSPAIRKGLDRADRFILELDLRLVTEDAVSSLLADKVLLQPPNSLLDVVSPETARLLEENDAKLDAMGMPRDARKWKKPWYVALWLLESASVQSGLVASASAESVIFEALGDRPLLGLETFEEQLGFFDDLSPELQDVMLQDSLRRLDAVVDEIQTLVSAWKRGDEERLEEMARDGIDALPDLEKFYDVMLTDRNQRWMTVFETLLDDPEYARKTIFVGVGALHLVGETGLVHLLRESGYEVEAIDQIVEIQ